MLINTTLGKYYPGNSLVHRLDPRTKLLALIFLIISTSLVRNLLGFFIISLFVMIVILLSCLPFRLVLRYLKPMLWFFISIIILNIFFTDGGARAGLLKATWEGLYNGIRVSYQFLVVAMCAAILILTTVPLQLADGIMEVLRPLRKIGIPVHQIPIMITISLYFIPTLFTEGEKLILAQKARGIRLEGRNVFRKPKVLTSIIIPLLRNAFRMADTLAIGMESRCYSGSTRTHLHEFKFNRSDIISMVVVGVLMTVITAFLDQ